MPFMIGTLLKYANYTSDMQGMVWGEPERGNAQNGMKT